MTPNAQPVQDEAHPTILVIDDELGPRESLRFLLKNEYRVLCAENVARGLQLLREHSPDTVIIDIRMPGQDGIDGLREIRKLDPDLAVIMLTGFAAVGTAQKAIRLMANDYMEKPFDATEMRLAVRRHIEQTRLRRKRNKLLNETAELDQRIQELQGKERLTELGQSSAEFVHDLRNVLNMVTGSSSLLREEVEALQQRQTDSPSEAGYYLDMLEAAMSQSVDMLDTWQRLIRQNPQQKTRFGVHEFVRSCVEACQPAALAARAHLSCETLGDEADVHGDRVQLARVLNNLIQNAVHALPAENGRIRVRSVSLDTSVLVSVSDNGCGIQEDNLKHLFSPDFTTRRSHGGMGLGLFIAQKIAQSHDGSVTVESSVNQGSTFTLQLPRAATVSGDGTD